MNGDPLINFDLIDDQSTAVILGDQKINYRRFRSDIEIAKSFISMIEEGRRCRIGILIEDPYWRWIFHLACLMRGHALLTLKPESALYWAHKAKCTLIISDQNDQDLSSVPVVYLEALNDASLAEQWPHVELTSTDATEKEATRIVFTSGTTGAPNWVEWTYENMARRVILDASHLQFGKDTRLFCPQATYTTSGFKYPLATWRLGGSVILKRMQDPLKEAIMKSNVLRAVPSVIVELLKLYPGNWRGSDERHLLLGGSRLPKTISSEALKRACAQITISCGSTEAGSIAKGDQSLLEIHPCCVGYILPEVRLEVLDESGKSRPIGEPGTLRIQTPYMVSLYGNDESASENIFRGGWFYPGDEAIILENNLLILLGRRSQILNLNGKKFSVANIEAELEKLIGVSAACLITIPTHQGDCIGVILETSQKIPNEVIFETLATYPTLKNVRSIIVQLEQFPRNDMGKVIRQQVEKMVAQSLSKSNLA
jgi:acyl-CoA synthetase (AMP-forming)/AMP-acid ligase II